MDVSLLKREIIKRNKVSEILEFIGCHSINFHAGTEDDYYTCGNKDGDNPSAITVYCGTSLKTINYTRELSSKKTEHDLIDLVMFNKKINFFEAIKLICDVVGVNYYGLENDDDLPESIKITRLINEMSIDNEDEYAENVTIEPKQECILGYYKKCCNDLFKEDGVSYATQAEFELGFDDESNLITIPIRDELGNLVGIKGRQLEKNCSNNKYTYLIRCPRGKILYNLFRSYDEIVSAGFVIVVESEKACMQLYDMGIYNVVALSGSKLTAVQRQKLMNLHTDIVLALDKDIALKRLQDIANKFPIGYNISAILDDKEILDEKESPTDDPFKWDELWADCRVDLRKQVV